MKQFYRWIKLIKGLVNRYFPSSLVAFLQTDKSNIPTSSITRIYSLTANQDTRKGRVVSGESQNGQITSK